MANSPRASFSVEDAQRIAAAVMRFETEPRAVQDDGGVLTTPQQAPVQFVRLSSLTTSSGRYPGFWLKYDAETSAWSDGDAVWVVTPNGETPALSTRYEARGFDYAAGRFVFVIQQIAAGGGGSPLTTKGDIYVYGTTNVGLPVGLTKGMRLEVDPGTPTGLIWVTPSCKCRTPKADKVDNYDQSTCSGTNTATFDNIELFENELLLIDYVFYGAVNPLASPVATFNGIALSTGGIQANGSTLTEPMNTYFLYYLSTKKQSGPVVVSLPGSTGATGARLTIISNVTNAPFSIAIGTGNGGSPLAATSGTPPGTIPGIHHAFFAMSTPGAATAWAAPFNGSSQDYDFCGTRRLATAEHHAALATDSATMTGATPTSWAGHILHIIGGDDKSTAGGTSGQVQFNNDGATGGATGLVYGGTSSPTVTVTSQNAAYVGLTVTPAAANTANVQNWTTSAGIVTSAISKGGYFTSMATSAPLDADVSSGATMGPYQA